MKPLFMEAFTTVEQLQSFLDWEKGLREEIAKEIQSFQFEFEAKARFFEDDTFDGERDALEHKRYASCYKHAAMIVRGQG
jgi:hypothetical protein